MLGLQMCNTRPVRISIFKNAFWTLQSDKKVLIALVTVSFWECPWGWSPPSHTYSLSSSSTVSSHSLDVFMLLLWVFSCCVCHLSSLKGSFCCLLFSCFALHFPCLFFCWKSLTLWQMRIQVSLSASLLSGCGCLLMCSVSWQDTSGKSVVYIASDVFGVSITLGWRRFQHGIWLLLSWFSLLGCLPLGCTHLCRSRLVDN